MDGQPAQKSTLHALLIGVDCYLPNQIPGVGYYPSLHGCVRDVRHVEQFLLARLGVAPACIQLLTATNTGDPEPPEKPAQWPTYGNMVDAFGQISARAQPGDQVYIHYSGHGGRGKTHYPELKGPNGLDEALVPTDIGNSEARYLRDVELAYMLQKMVDRDLVVTLVLDSCHSGGATRAGLVGRPRGARFVDMSTRAAGSLVAARADLAANWVRLNPAGAPRDPDSGAGWLPEPQGYVLLAACRPSESAFEYPFEKGESNGALTYWFLKSLAGNLNAGLTYQETYNRLLGLIYSQFPDQTPMLLGDTTRRVFGSDHATRGMQVDVLAVDLPCGRVRLATGEAQGIAAGARFALYPAGQEDFSRTQDRLAFAAVNEAGATASWAELSEVSMGGDGLEPGAQALLLSPQSSVRVQRTMGVAPRRDLPANIDQAAALKRVTDALQGSGGGFVRFPGPGEAPDYLVGINPDETYDILDPGGQALGLRPALPIAASDSGALVIERLAHLARYRALLELANYDDLSPLANTLKLLPQGIQDDYMVGQRPDPQPLAVVGGFPPGVRPGQWLFLRVTNLSDRVLNISLLQFAPDWSVRQTFPTFEDFEPLDPGEGRLAYIQIDLPEDYPAGRVVFKAFGTTGPASFHWLELPALDRAPAARFARADPRTPLEELLAAIGKGGTRSVDTLVVPGTEWVTADYSLQITR